MKPFLNRLQTAENRWSANAISSVDATVCTRNGFRFLVLFVLCLCLGGCSSQSAPGQQAQSAEKTARTEVDRGPVKVAVEVTPAPARLSDEPTLTLTIEHERGIEIEKPPFGESVGNFVIRDFREPLPEVNGDREVIKQIYTLEPTTAGPTLIDPIVVNFVDKRSEGDGRSHQIETEALTVEILSVVANAPSLDALHGFEKPKKAPSPAKWWIWGVIAAALIALVVLYGLYRWRLRRSSLAPPLSPREQAELELDALWSSNTAVEDVKKFYIELTLIVRRYIERTTGIQAPEQTTEEFLREIGRGGAFIRDDRQKLKDFLESADLVKFAAHQPHRQDIDESFRRARLFISSDEQEVAA